MKPDLISISGVDDLLHRPWEPDKAEERLDRRMSRKSPFKPFYIHVYFGWDYIRVNDTWMGIEHCRTILACAAVDPSTDAVVAFGDEALQKVNSGEGYEEVWPFRNLDKVNDIILTQCLAMILKGYVKKKRSRSAPRFFFYANSNHTYDELMRLIYLASFEEYHAEGMFEERQFMMHRFGEDMEELGHERRLPFDNT